MIYSVDGGGGGLEIVRFWFVWSYQITKTGDCGGRNHGDETEEGIEISRVEYLNQVQYHSGLSADSVTRVTDSVAYKVELKDNNRKLYDS